MVGLGRLELPTSRLSGVRSNQLSYRPNTPISQNIIERDTKTAIPAFILLSNYRFEIISNQSLERR